MNAFVNVVKGEVVVDGEVFVSEKRIARMQEFIGKLVDEWIKEGGGEEKINDVMVTSGALMVFREMQDWFDVGLLEKREDPYWKEHVKDLEMMVDGEFDAVE